MGSFCSPEHEERRDRQAQQETQETREFPVQQDRPDLRDHVV